MIADTANEAFSARVHDPGREHAERSEKFSFTLDDSVDEPCPESASDPILSRAATEEYRARRSAEQSAALPASGLSAAELQREQGGWASALLAPNPTASTRELLRRTGLGLGLSALYGAAIGARVGGASLLQHAIGVPLGLLLVALIGAPSVFVFLSICRAPIDGPGIADSVARAIASAGLLLAGLAPAAALFVVSSETPGAAAGVVEFGLLLGGGVALARMLKDVVRQAFQGRAESVVGALVVASGFALFAVALAARVWWSLLPILGGVA